MIQKLPTPNTSNRMIRLPEVIHRTGRSRSSIYKDIAEGNFPSPVKLGRNARAIGWPECVIEEWIQEQIRGTAA